MFFLHSPVASATFFFILNPPSLFLLIFSSSAVCLSPFPVLPSSRPWRQWEIGWFLITTWLSGLLLLIELNPCPSPIFLCPLSVSSFSIHLVWFFGRVFFCFVFFFFPFWLSCFPPFVCFYSYRPCFHFFLSPCALPLVLLSCLFPFLFISLFPLSLSFTPCNRFFFLLVLLVSFILYFLNFWLHAHTHTSLLSSALLLLEHSDTVVMVTPIIFWHEWRILYWWDGMAEGEKRRVMERKTKTHRKKEITGRENLNDMEMIIPAAYDTKHFQPVIFLLLIS